MTPAALRTPASGDASLLELQDVHTYYGRIHALQGIDIEVGRGEIVTLIGANGAGKTTTLRRSAACCARAGGTVCFDGQDIDQVPAARARPSAGIGHVPEGRRIFSRLTVLENLADGRLHPHAGRDRGDGSSSTSSSCSRG